MKFTWQLGLFQTGMFLILCIDMDTSFPPRSYCCLLGFCSSTWDWPIVIINYGLLSSLSRVLKYSQSSKAGSAAPHCVVPITVELRPKATTHRANTYTGFMLPVSEV